MMLGFFFCSGCASACPLSAVALSGATAVTPAVAAAAAVPNMNSRRLVGNAKLPSLSYGWDGSKVIFEAELQFAWIVRIISGRADRCECVGVGERQVCRQRIPRLAKVGRVGQVEHFEAKLEGRLSESGKLSHYRKIQPAEGWAGDLGWCAAQVGGRC